VEKLEVGHCYQTIPLVPGGAQYRDALD